MTFQAYLIEQHGHGVSARFVDYSEDRLDPGELTIRVRHSSVNYKDALAVTGAGRIIRRYPCIGGIDLAGEVIASVDPRFTPGQPIVATSFDIGVAHHGGFAQRARLPADWVLPLPAGLSPWEAMALGTAGFTAALGIQRMEDNGLTPAAGPVLVTGATGGVGSLAIDMLAGRGYQVVALTGKATQADYLKHLGATEIMLRDTLPLDRVRPLDTAKWAGVVDNLGGPVLSWAASTCRQGATIASIGLAASGELNMTVMPFILRGVSLLGIDSGYWPMPGRARLWARMASDLKPRHLGEIARSIAFAELPDACARLIAGGGHGRLVVDLPD